jgi:hypothetical protein
MLVEKRVKEIITDLESSLISVSDLLYQLEMENYPVEEDSYKDILIEIKQKLSGLLNGLLK